MSIKRFCECCKHLKEINEFYKFKNGQFDTVCKECVSKGTSINCFALHKFLIRYDIPLDPVLWKRLLLKQQNGSEIALCGKYLSVMKLKPYCNFNFLDSYRFKDFDGEEDDD